MVAVRMILEKKQEEKNNQLFDQFFTANLQQTVSILVT